MVKVIMTEANDWVVIQFNGEIIHEGHSISNTDFCCILREIGVDVKEKLISDKAMEQGRY
jgi:hypothetical protein